MMVTQGRVVRTTSKRLLGIALAAVTVAAVLVGGATPASAHASLLETRPANGEVLQTPPDQVLLRYNETVSLPDNASEVYDSSGDKLDLGKADHVNGQGSTVGVDLPELDKGAYVVTWRVGSADSHP